MTDQTAEDRLAVVTQELSHMSGLSEWVTWFGVLSVASALLIVPVVAGSLLSGFPIEAAFYGLIGLVAGITILRSFTDASFLQRETKLAAEQVQDLIERDDISGFLAASDSSQFRTHIEALYTIFQQDSEIAQDNLIEMLQERLLARNRLSELFASILITLGLIGTIAGLIVMVSELRISMQDFDPSGSGNVVNELMRDGGALSGLDTAFYTTLMGAVLGGVMLRVLTNVVATNITRYTAFIAELSEVYVLPSLRNTARELERAGYYRQRDE